MKKMTMKNIALLLVAVGCCVCEPQADSRAESSSSSVNQNHGEPLITMVMEKVKVLETRLENVKDLETRLEKSEKEVEELRGLIGGQPRVAFSASLLESGYGVTGPFTVATSLKYKNVFSNIGSGYNPSTGVFTAMVKGMYYFRFSAFCNWRFTTDSIVSLMKNGERLVSVWDSPEPDRNDIGSNAAVVPLETGDSVYVKLWANTSVYDDQHTYNTFSGFLLFPM